MIKKEQELEKSLSEESSHDQLSEFKTSNEIGLFTFYRQINGYEKGLSSDRESNKKGNNLLKIPKIPKSRKLEHSSEKQIHRPTCEEKRKEVKPEVITLYYQTPNIIKKKEMLMKFQRKATFENEKPLKLPQNKVDSERVLGLKLPQEQKKERDTIRYQKRREVQILKNIKNKTFFKALQDLKKKNKKDSCKKKKNYEMECLDKKHNLPFLCRKKLNERKKRTTYSSNKFQYFYRNFTSANDSTFYVF